MKSVRPLPVLQEGLSDDAHRVLSACEALVAAYHQDDLSTDDAILSATTETLVGTLGNSTVEKLAIITWHFDASGSESNGLRSFLKNPVRDPTIWEAVHYSYMNMTKQDISLQEFKTSHDFLLYLPLGNGTGS